MEGGEGHTRLLGLIVERATGMMRHDPRDLVDSAGGKSRTGVAGSGGTIPPAKTRKPAAAPFLGPVLIDDRGVIQLLHAQKLLPDNVRDLVFAPA